ncbi:biopolymer transporter ExbD [Thalassobius sp. Cn5-15]|uniref:ExbD/TolR family protein n=1 Tax=Thalassobius sp. Cn5-15 TaxID=2917763 RepID=UPI001EF28171|nr:biopolymer transporter ExbD [Thalassobius sp. Cn5-15]MCG7494449.1 biopolymer transporter ExbD [Thalassobius sp. Cn5-15]
MNFQPPGRPEKAESIVPMINVVFLLLIFFLMTAQIAPPDPFEVEVPQAVAAADPQADLSIYLSQSGELAYQDHRGDAVIAALKGEGVPLDKVVLNADARAPGKRLAQVMAQLRAAGVGAVELVVEPS